MLHRNSNHKIQISNKGFSLIEVIVSLSIFAIVSLMCVGAFISVSGANTRSQTTRVALDNLNYAMESMSREIRLGSTYHCDASIAPVTSPLDCAGGATSVVFKDAGGVQIEYRLDVAGSICGVANSICRKVGAATAVPFTSPEVSVTNLLFFVTGSAVNDQIQPQVHMVINGIAGSNPKTQSPFNVQTTMTQRAIDS